MSSNQPIEDLLDALETLGRISSATTVGFEAARAERERVREIFETGLSGPLTSNWTPPKDHDGEIRRVLDLHDQAKDREKAFLDAFGSLIRISGDSANCAAAEAIYRLLRGIKMIDLEDDPGDFMTAMPPWQIPDRSLEPQAARQQIRDGLLDHHRQMVEFLQQRDKRAEEQTQRAAAMLAEALEVARSLRDSN